MSLNPIKNKNIWIIGASSGIGEALAQELAQQGAHVILSARRKEQLEDVKKNLAGDNHLVAPLDVSDHKAVKAAFKDIQESYDHLDGVVFLAALYAPHDKQKKDIAFMHKMLDVNIGGAFNVVDVVQEAFKKQGYGQITLCGSVAGYRGLPYGQPYCATKAALISYAESLHMELKSDNIDVKIINPGFVETPLTDKNDFPMPMIISAEKAGKALAKGLQSSSFEIHFPKRFTYLMKMISLLPNWLYLKLVGQIRT